MMRTELVVSFLAVDWTFSVGGTDGELHSSVIIVPDCLIQ